MSRSFAKRRVLAAMALVTSICIWLAVSSSLFPVFSDDHPQSLQVIESDNPMVIQTAQWTSQVAVGASGGSYLYNAPANPDRDNPALTLQFNGPYLEVIYVSGPNLGALAIEVDGTVLRTVITANDRTLYNQRTTINYLTDELHTLRVYAQAGGVVGVDAFVVYSLPSPETMAPPKNNADISSAINVPRAPGSCSHNYPADTILGRAYSDLSISDDGHYVVYTGAAYGIPGLTDINSYLDVLLWNYQTCTYSIVSRNSNGAQADGDSSQPAISGDGRHVAFQTRAVNFGVPSGAPYQQIFVRDLQTGLIEPVSVNANGEFGSFGAWGVKISTDGNVIAFTSDSPELVLNDTNNARDVFVRDMRTHTIQRVTVNSAGEQGFSGSSIVTAVSGNGRYVVYISSLSNLATPENNISQVYIHDLETGATEIISVSPSGSPANASVDSADISDDGRYVVFTTHASNLLPNVTESYNHVFLYDRQLNQLTLINQSYDGQPVVEWRYLDTVISGDGRYIFFTSIATNLVPNDTNDADDVFMYDRNTQQVRLVTVSYTGAPSLGYMSASDLAANQNGRYVVFAANKTNLLPVDACGHSCYFIIDNLIPYPPQNLSAAGISPSSIRLDWSSANPLPIEFQIERSLDGQTNWSQIAVVPHDATMFLDTGLSPNTNYYYRLRSHYVPIDTFSVYSNTVTYRTETRSAPTGFYVQPSSRTSISLTWTDTNPSETEYHIERQLLSGSGFEEIAVLPATGATYSYTDTNLPVATGYSYRVRAYWASDSQFSIYSPVNSGTTYPACAPNALVQRVAMDNNGRPVSASFADMTGDGHYIVFSTLSQIPPEDTNSYYDTYVHDRLTCNTTLVSRTSNGQSGNYSSISASISDDGRWVAFSSEATDLVSNTTARVYQIYLYDLQTGQMMLISHSPVGAPGDAGSGNPKISSDGRFIAFDSNATNLVANNPVPAVRDAYIYDRQTDQITRVSVDSSGNAGNGNSRYPTISDDGRYVAFESTATNLVPNDTNTHRDIFVHDRQTGQTTLISTRIDGTPTLLDSQNAMISGNGRYVVFDAYDRLSSDPLEPQGQIYLRDLQTGAFELISRASDGSFADRYSDYPVITPDGHFVFYITAATNLGDDGPEHITNVYDNYVY